MRLPRGSSIGPARGWRLPAALAACGAILAVLAATAVSPEYESEASVVVERDRVAADPVEMRRLAELAEGSQVAEEAATLLGGDVPGADVLTRVSVEPAPEGGALRIVARADSRDYAPAVAAAYAAAIAEVLGGPLREGAAPAPAESRGGASPLLWALIGLLSGAGFGLVLARVLAAAPPLPSRPRRARGAGSEQPPDGDGPLAALPVAAALVDFDPDGVAALKPSSRGPVADLLERSEAGPGTRRSLAVFAAEEGDSSGAAAVAIAVGAAERGLHALVLDARFAAPAVAGLLRVSPSPGLADYLRGAAGPRDVLRRVSVGADHRTSRLACLPAGTGAPPEGLAGSRFKGLIERLVSVYDLVVIAGPEADADARQSGALAAAGDEAVVVCAPGAHSQAARDLAALADGRGAGLHGAVEMERS